MYEVKLMAWFIIIDWSNSGKLNMVTKLHV